MHDRQMPNGFVKLRRGLVDHLVDGRMDADEYCVFCLLLPLADFRSGIWQGSGVALSAYLKAWSLRKCQRVLKSLARKNYLTLRSLRGKRGNFPVIIHKYHEFVEKVTTTVTPLIESDDTSALRKPKVTTPVHTIEEVRLRTKTKKNTAQPQREHSHEEIRRIEAKQQRLERERELESELNVGRGPMCSIPELSAQIIRIAKEKSL